MSDYYAVLGLSRQAEDDEIAKAYRRYAMAYNPQCHQQGVNTHDLVLKFKLVCQAYAILSHPSTRAVYDLYGEEGVRHGGTGENGFVGGGLDIDNIDPNKVFNHFFGVDNPFQIVGTIDGVQNNQHGFFSTVTTQPISLPKCASIHVELPITLEDVFYGAKRKATWRCTHYHGVENAMYWTVESADLNVTKGAGSGDSFLLSGRGDTAPGHERGDVVVTLKLLPHDRFRREGDDLVMVVPIMLHEALCGTTVMVQTMDGRSLSVLIDEIVHPTFRTRIAGEGLPRRLNETCTAATLYVDGASCEDNDARGNLIVEYATKFPSFLTLEQKSELRRILDAK